MSEVRAHYPIRRRDTNSEGQNEGGRAAPVGSRPPPLIMILRKVLNISQRDLINNIIFSLWSIFSIVVEQFSQPKEGRRNI